MGLTSLVDPGRDPVRCRDRGAALGALGCWLAIRHCRRPSGPILSLDAFGHETFRSPTRAAWRFGSQCRPCRFCCRCCFRTSGTHPRVQAGAMVPWVFVGNLAIKPATTPAAAVRHRSVLIAASAVAAVTVVLMAFMQPDTPDWLLATLLFVSGAARSGRLHRLQHHRVRRRRPGTHDRVNALFSTLSQIAAGFGVAVAAALLKAARPLQAAGPSAPYSATLLVIAIVLGMALVEALMSPSVGEVIRPMRKAKS